MAGGFLSKTPGDIDEGKGNWDPETISGKIFRNLYYKPSCLKSLVSCQRNRVLVVGNDAPVNNLKSVRKVILGE